MSNQIFSKIDGAIATLIGYIETGIHRRSVLDYRDRAYTGSLKAEMGGKMPFVMDCQNSSADH